MKTFTLQHGLFHQKKIMLPKVTENQVSPSVNCRNEDVYLRFREYINATVKHYYSKMWIPELLRLAEVGVWQKLWFRRRNKLPWRWIEYILTFIFSKFHNNKANQNINMIVKWRGVLDVTTTQVLVIFSLLNFRIKIFLTGSLLYIDISLHK
jgi:hypothetical protein